jgi:hypothetical protein
MAVKNGKTLEGRYANYLSVGHNAFEFVLDFGQYYSETEDAELYIRIVTAPNYAKEFSKILQRSIRQFEENFGDIQESSEHTLDS